MSNTIEVKVPDIGNAKDVEVIEVLVKPGAHVKKDDSLLTLESDKASMEIPSPESGVVKDVKISVGNKVSAGALILTLEVESAASATSETKSAAAPTAAAAPAPAAAKAPAPAAAAPASNAAPTPQEVRVPDIGNAHNVEVIEISVRVGDEVAVDDTLITLEGDKATMEIPAPFAGKVASLKVKVGDKVNKGDLILVLDAVQNAPKSAAPASAPAAGAAAPAPVKQEAPVSAPAAPATQVSTSTSDKLAHAGPHVRRFARELGVDLTRVQGTGHKGRVTEQDVQRYVKEQLTQPKSSGGFAMPEMPSIDFSQFGEVSTQPLSRIKKLSGQNLHRNWITIPHVTQFDEADITEMEAFRVGQKAEADAQGVKLTPLVFMMKAVVAALKKYPIFNSSLDPRGEHLIMKNYYHVGVAVDTPNGLVVPVVRNVDQKGMFTLAKELGEISVKARNKGLTTNDMQGSCFTISSLGGIGGTAFTPIVNAPDVAILGVSKASMKPVYRDGQFVPRLMLPLSLSYDHRVVDGADAARFTAFLAQQLGDIRRLLL